jgi:hypothetical protein
LSCQEKVDKTVFDTLFEDCSGLIKSVIDEKDKYEVQILFSPITRRADSIIIEDNFFNFRPGEYFYPASTVKMPVVFMAMQKLEELRLAGIEIDRNTPLIIDSTRTLHTPVLWDSTNTSYKPTLAHYIDKVFATNDNDAYNRLFEFCGLDYINAGLKSKGIFTNSRIVNRLGVSGYSFEENKYTPPIHFLDDSGNIIYSNENAFAQGYHLTIVDNTQKGIAYINEKNKRIETPYDFSEKNFINIKDLQEALKRFIFPELHYPLQGFNINHEDRSFAMQSMANLPKEHLYLADNKHKHDDKYFFFGGAKEPIPDHIVIRNMAGYGYGYMTECAYIQDKDEGIEYFLTATIHVNNNQTYNDGIYEYDKIGKPFLEELTQVIHNYMIKNK